MPKCQKCRGEKPGFLNYVFIKTFASWTKFMYCSKCHQTYTDVDLEAWNHHRNRAYGFAQILGGLLGINVFMLVLEITNSGILALFGVLSGYLIIMALGYISMDFKKVNILICPRCFNRSPYHWDLLKYRVTLKYKRRKGEIQCSLCKKIYTYQSIRPKFSQVLTEVGAQIIAPCCIFFLLYKNYIQGCIPTAIISILWSSFAGLQIYFQFCDFQVEE